MTLSQAISRRWIALRDWVRDGTPLWLLIVVAASLCLFAYYFPVHFFAISEDLPARVSWAGLFLQFAGLGTVVAGLVKSRKDFNKEPIWCDALKWIARFRYIIVPRKPVHHSLRLDATINFDAGANLQVNREKPEPSLEERVADVERAVESVRKEVADANNRIVALQTKADQNLDRERQERAEQDRRIVKQLEESVVGGIHLELAGLFYLGLGITLATIPEDAATLLRWMGL